MKTTKLFIFSRKLHRFFVLIIFAMILIMAGTGLMLKYYWQPFGLDLRMIRSLHNQMSGIFTIVLSLMALSGIYMYFFPYIQAAQKKREGETGANTHTITNK